jgi:hypothetical protein
VLGMRTGFSFQGCSFEASSDDECFGCRFSVVGKYRSQF